MFLPRPRKGVTGKWARSRLRRLSGTEITFWIHLSFKRVLKADFLVFEDSFLEGKRAGRAGMAGKGSGGLTVTAKYLSHASCSGL